MRAGRRKVGRLNARNLISNRPGVVNIGGTEHSAGVTCHNDGTFTYLQNRKWQMNKPNVPASVLATLTPWEFLRIDNKLPL